jgi:hypothetical protein
LSATAISISPRQTAERPAGVEYDPAFAAPAKIQDRLLLGNAMLGQFITGFAARSFVVALSTIRQHAPCRHSRHLVGGDHRLPARLDL